MVRRIKGRITDYIFTAVIALMPIQAMAGMDFTHMADSAMTIKDFKGYGEAQLFAHRVKWNDSAIDAMKLKMDNLVVTAISAARRGDNKKQTWARDQYRFLKAALEVMLVYKLHGEKGDPAMYGASFYAGSCPI